MPPAIPKLLKDIFLLSDIWFKIITMSVPVDNPRNKSPIIIIDKLEDWIKNNDNPAFTNKIVSILIRVALLANLVIVKADNIPIIIESAMINHQWVENPDLDYLRELDLWAKTFVNDFD